MLARGVLEEQRGGLERGREGAGAEQVRRGPVRDAGRAWSQAWTSGEPWPIAFREAENQFSSGKKEHPCTLKVQLLAEFKALSLNLEPA